MALVGSNAQPGGNSGGDQARDGFLRRLEELEQIVQKIARRLDREAEALDDVADAISCLRKAVGLDPLLPGAGNGKGAVLAPNLSDPPHPEPKAQTLQFEWHADGSASVRIDFGLWFKLPPALADVMSLLANESGPSQDELVGWKTEHELAVELTRKTKAKRPVTKRAVIQRIHRLRKSFIKQGAEDSLIQTNRNKGWRFAFVRKTVPVVAKTPAVTPAKYRF